MQGSDSYRLVVRRGPAPNTVFELTKDSMRVGRDITNDITINDPEVSRHHLTFVRGAGGYTLEDNRSTNGTFINGVRVTTPRPLRAGEMIGLGETVTLLYEVLSAGTVAGAEFGGTVPSAFNAAPLPNAPSPYSPPVQSPYSPQPAMQPGAPPNTIAPASGFQAPAGGQPAPYTPPGAPQNNPAMPQNNPAPGGYNPNAQPGGYAPSNPYNPQPQPGYSNTQDPATYAGANNPVYGQPVSAYGAPASASVPQAPGAAGTGYGDYDPYAVREEEGRNTTRLILIGCAGLSLFCCCGTVISAVIVDQLCLWNTLPIISSIVRAIGYTAVCS